MYIYHIVKPDWWKNFEGKNEYTSETLTEEGFIHCSTEAQLYATCNRHFKGENLLVILKLYTNNIVSELKFEQAPQVGEEFPHIYGPINLDAVVEVFEIKRGSDGEFQRYQTY